MNILMIAYLFPPDSSSGSFRPLHFARHLNEMGEKIYILTAREQDFMPYQKKDHKLLEYLDDNITIVCSKVLHPQQVILKLRDRVSGGTQEQENIPNTLDKHGFVDSSTSSWRQQVKDTLTDLLAMPDPEIGWLPSAIKKGLNVIKRRNIDVIYVTGGPWTSLLIATILKRLTGKPLVLDFRDPWVANPIFLLKSKLSRFIESFMERKVIASADHIVTNTEELKQNFLMRYPILSPDKLTTITNGFEEYIESPNDGKSKRFTVLHAGSLNFRNPKFLLQATIRLIEQNVIPKEDIRIVFLGGISMQDPDLDNLLKHPLLENVLEILPRVPYQKAVDYQKNSDVLFLMQPEEFHLQIPRKLYEYMAFRKIILGITPQNSATARIIQENQLGIVVANQLSDIESALKTFHERWENGSLQPLSQKTSDKFMNKHLTTTLQKVFRECVASSNRPEENWKDKTDEPKKSTTHMLWVVLFLWL